LKFYFFFFFKQQIIRIINKRSKVCSPPRRPRSNGERDGFFGSFLFSLDFMLSELLWNLFSLDSCSDLSSTS
jgi:hypothetical protein